MRFQETSAKLDEERGPLWYVSHLSTRARVHKVQAPGVVRNIGLCILAPSKAGRSGRDKQMAGARCRSFAVPIAGLDCASKAKRNGTRVFYKKYPCASRASRASLLECCGKAAMENILESWLPSNLPCLLAGATPPVRSSTACRWLSRATAARYPHCYKRPRGCCRRPVFRNAPTDA